MLLILEALCQVLAALPLSLSPGRWWFLKPQWGFLCLKLLLLRKERQNLATGVFALLKEKHQRFDRFRHTERGFENLKSTVLVIRLRTNYQI